MRKLVLTFVPLLALAAAGLSAQETEPATGEAQPLAERPLTDNRWEVSLGATFFDNFFQAPDEAEQQEVRAAVGRFSGRARTGAERRLEVFGRVEQLEYDENLEYSTHAAVGLRRDGERHDWDVEARWDHNRPSFDVGDEFDRADGLRLGAEYAFDWTAVVAVGLAAEAGNQSFDLRSDKDSDLAFGGPFARFGSSRFSTEVGYQTGSRDVENPVDDYDEDTLYLTLRFAPTERWYGSLRYRDRDRQYTFDDPASSNLDREDDRRDWTLAVAADLTRRFGWSLYGVYLDADSTKASRIFESSSVATWVSYRF